IRALVHGTNRARAQALFRVKRRNCQVRTLPFEGPVPAQAQLPRGPPQTLGRPLLDPLLLRRLLRRAVPQANVKFSGVVEAGLYQLNIVMPSNLGSGDKAIVATVGGVQSQTNILLSVQ